MLKKLRNNRACAWYVILWLTPATSIFWEAAATMGGAAYVMRHKHRARKAVEFCVAEGYTDYICNQNVKLLSREEILAYIKDDTIPNKQIKNYGNFK